MSSHPSPTRMPSPTLSIVLCTIDNYRRIRRTVEHLKKQTISHQLELLLVAGSAEGLSLDEDLTEYFYSVRLIEVGRIESPSEAKAHALRQATSALVVFAEDHSWPEPGWAKSIVDAHAAGYAAVGPRIRNANPRSTLSRANYLSCFGRWSDLSRAGEVEQTPWHNTSYRKELLIQYESDLPNLLTVEGLLQDRLRARGYRLFLLPECGTDHVNISRPSSWIRHAFWGGKLFGGVRSADEQWGVLRRFLYILGSPLIPLLKFKRLAPEIASFCDQYDRRGRLMSALMLSFVIHAFGEATGYAVGVGSASDRYVEFEAKRFEALDKHDALEFGV